MSCEQSYIMDFARIQTAGKLCFVLMMLLAIHMFLWICSATFAGLVVITRGMLCCSQRLPHLFHRTPFSTSLCTFPCLDISSNNIPTHFVCHKTAQTKAKPKCCAQPFLKSRVMFSWAYICTHEWTSYIIVVCFNCDATLLPWQQSAACHSSVSFLFLTCLNKCTRATCLSLQCVNGTNDNAWR